MKKSEKIVKSGFAAIIGMPNVGKSTLLNQLVKRKLAIVTPKPQTTRNKIMGIVNFNDAQVILLDTPGLHRGGPEFNRLMVKLAYNTLADSDVALFMVDVKQQTTTGKLHPENRRIISNLPCRHKPVFLLLNKIDLISKKLLLPIIDEYARLRDFDEIIPISAKQGDGVDRLLNAIVSRLPQGPQLFPDSSFTDRTLDFMISELIREKVFLLTHDEVPYSTAVLVEQIRPGQGQKAAKILYIHARIYVEKKGHKGIIVGKAGKKLKQIGRAARIDIQNLVRKKIYLDLFVSVEPNWTRHKKGIKKTGWQEWEVL